MPGSTPALMAVIVGLLAGAIGYVVICIRGRRLAEATAGLEALAALKWRDFHHLVLEALRREGYVEEDLERQPADSGFDAILVHDGQRYLLTCKHGRAYRVGEQAVREFSAAIRMQGAAGGIVVTLGHTDGFAREVAAAHHIQMIDGQTIWSRVAPLVAEAARQAIEKQAGSCLHRRLAMTAAASVGLSLAAYLLVAAIPAEPAASTAIHRPAATAAVQPTAPAPAAVVEIPAMPAELDESEIARRRAAAAQSVGQLPEVGSASWSTRSTLVVALREVPAPPPAPSPVDEACRILVQYEELRFTRLQIEPPAGSDSPVRWRQCR